MQDDIIPKVATSDGTVLKVGDVFYYRGKGSESAVVYPVIVRSINDKIAGLSQIADIEMDGGIYEDAREAPSLYVEIEKIEVIQMRTDGLRTLPPAAPPPPPLPRGLLNGLKKKNRRS